MNTTLPMTHEVTNQATPFVDLNLYAINRPLQDALRWHHPGFDAARFQALGAEAGSAAMQAHARLANTHAPELRSHDRFGRRIDQVEFHPSYHALLGGALRHRLHGSPWAEGPGSHVERAAAFMLYTEAEPSVLCPVSMSYAVTPALRANRGVWADWGDKIASPHYDPRFLPVADKSAVTLGMGMTEKQGGSDVRSNTTQAEADGTTPGARVLPSPATSGSSRRRCATPSWCWRRGAGGLSCFFLPRLLPDGSVNAIAVQRLKHKLGNHANASSEVEFHRATGWLVGDAGRGVAQILAMGALTRLDCALGTAGLMRHALSLALHHTAQRQAFGKRLIDQPMMRNVLADLALDSEAATALAMRLARAVDRTEHGQDADGFEAVMRRVLTPIAKFWVCKRGSAFGQEAMECLGGNGYVEEQGEGVMARIYREMPLNSIWEGAANIQALDLLRALRTGPVADALMLETAGVRAAYPAVQRLGELVRHGLDGATDEAQARRLARDVALLVQASLLHQSSPDGVAAAFVAGRITEPSDVYGSLPAGVDLDGVLTRAMTWRP
jgi:putative acyl-CoA dehydrogenase